MSNNEEGKDFHDLDEGFHANDRNYGFIQVEHTGPAIPGFKRTSGRSDGAFTTVFETVRTGISGMYDPESDNY